MPLKIYSEHSLCLAPARGLRLLLYTRPERVKGHGAAEKRGSTVAKFSHIGIIVGEHNALPKPSKVNLFKPGYTLVFEKGWGNTYPESGGIEEAVKKERWAHPEQKPVAVVFSEKYCTSGTIYVIHPRVRVKASRVTEVV